MSDAMPRVPWTAIITTAVIVVGLLVSLSTGLISVGTNTAQIAINTVELARQRAEIAALEQRLPIADARIEERLDALGGMVARLRMDLDNHVRADETALHDRLNDALRSLHREGVP